MGRSRWARSPEMMELERDVNPDTVVSATGPAAEDGVSFEARTRGTASVNPVVRTEDLTKHFGHTVALDGLTLEISPGAVFGFLGPNGAGKTTTIRLLLGLTRPTRGSASVLGLDPWRDAVALHRHIGYVPGEFAVWPQLTGGEMLRLLGALHGSVDEAYRDELIRRFDFDPGKRGRSYSKGNRQKVGVIAAFQSRAEILILDEPTNGLDPLMEVEFQKCVREARDRGQTVFLSSHILSEVEALCDRIAILRRGRIVDVGTLDQLRHLSAQTFELTFARESTSLEGVPGVKVLSVTGNVVRCSVQGGIRPLIERLARSDVLSISTEEPSLEEVFLRYYGPDGGDPVAGGS
jgi:polyether ionophore transport system ATP-binding protein